MKVILRKDFDQIGRLGDIVNVKDGYALNYLIPREIAYHASPESIKAIEEEKKVIAEKMAHELEGAKTLSEELANVSVTIPVKVGEEDKIFGTVTTQMIAEALEAKGYVIDKRKLEIPEAIKSLGIYDVTLKLHPEVTVTLKTWVVRE